MITKKIPVQSRAFDLTTTEGLKEAALAATKRDPDLFLLMGGPILYLQKKLFDKVLDVIKDAGDPAPVIREQRETAVEVIKAGKDSGVSELEVTLDQEAGIDLGSEIEGIPIKIKMGKSGKMKVVAKYK